MVLMALVLVASATFLAISVAFLVWPFYKEWQMKKSAARK